MANHSSANMTQHSGKMFQALAMGQAQNSLCESWPSMAPAIPAFTVKRTYVGYWRTIDCSSFPHTDTINQVGHGLQLSIFSQQCDLSRRCCCFISEPCPSTLLQRHMADLLRRDREMAPSFLNSVLNQLNWAFSEFIGMIQEVRLCVPSETDCHRLTVPRHNLRQSKVESKQHSAVKGARGQLRGSGRESKESYP